MDNSQYYKFTMTPTTAATGKQLTITNTKDVNNFVYSSLYSLANLTFTSLIPSPIIYVDAQQSSSYTLSSGNIINQFVNIGSTTSITLAKSANIMGSSYSPIPASYNLINSSTNFNGKNSFDIQGTFSTLSTVPFSACTISMLIYGKDIPGGGINNPYTILFGNGGTWYVSAAIVYADHKIRLPQPSAASTYQHVANTLVHYVFVRNGTSCKLFVNGVNVLSLTNAAILNGNSNSSPFTFFGEASNGQWAFKGEFGNIKFWDSALTDLQCSLIYTQEKSNWAIP
jgi:hypothetical protein